MTRRLLAAVFLALEVWFVRQQLPLAQGLSELFLLIIAGGLGLPALLILLFNPPLRRQRRNRGAGDFADSDFDPDSPLDVGAATLGLLVFALAPLVMVWRGLRSGVIEPIWDGSVPAAWADAPGRFVLWVAIYLGWSAGVAWLAWRVRGHHRTARATARRP